MEPAAPRSRRAPSAAPTGVAGRALDAESDALARALHQLLARSGGFTLHHRTLRPLHEGVSVCADPRASLRVPWNDWDHERVASWVRHHAERIERGDLHLGGWIDPDRDEVWLDLVRVYPESHRRQALLTGLRHQQHAVFDIGARSLLYLAGLTVASIEAMTLAGVFEAAR